MPFTINTPITTTDGDTLSSMFVDFDIFYSRREVVVRLRYWRSQAFSESVNRDLSAQIRPTGEVLRKFTHTLTVSQYNGDSGDRAAIHSKAKAGVQEIKGLDELYGASNVILTSY